MENPTTKTSQASFKLSILVARDGLSFCVSKGKKIVFFVDKSFSAPQSPENLLKEIKHFFSYDFDYMPDDIETVQVFYAHSLFTLVPRPFFDQSKLSDYLKYNVRLLPTDELSFDSLTSIDANLVFIPYTNINNYLVGEFGEFTYQHLVSHFIDHCHNRPKKAGETVFINVFPTHFDMAVFKNDCLVLSNSYNYFTPEDFVYYAIFACEHLNLDKQSLVMQLSGQIEDTSKIYKLLRRYIGELKIDREKPSQKIVAEQLKQRPPQHHYIFLKTI